jgi:phosphoketolase
MAAVDAVFAAVVRANRHLRPRVGNPDEMRSNRLLETLELLRFRVTDPEPSVPESVHGAVITALNEEAVASAALANKGGINLIHTYEAFGAKMHGAVRQEIIFANHCMEAGRPQRWLSIPLLLTSHTWENGKNEQSHQDPSMAESMLGELSHVSRVVYPADFNTAAAVMAEVYRTHGQIWTIVVPKADVPELLSADEARRALADGGIDLEWAGLRRESAELLLVAVGAYQLDQAVAAARRLGERSIAHRVVVLLEPGRFRRARTAREHAHQATPETRARLFPERCRGVILATHTRPEPMIGLLEPLRKRSIAAVGYISIGGTHNTPGLLFVNRATWAHILVEAAGLLELPREHLLDEAEIDALEGRRSPHGIIVPTIPDED